MADHCGGMWSYKDGRSPDVMFFFRSAKLSLFVSTEQLQSKSRNPTRTHIADHSGGTWSYKDGEIFWRDVFLLISTNIVVGVCRTSPEDLQSKSRNPTRMHIEQITAVECESYKDGRSPDVIDCHTYIQGSTGCAWHNVCCFSVHF